MINQNMRLKEVNVVRVYLTEGEAQLDKLLTRLRDAEGLRGVTVFRGISGFGDSGVIHQSTLIDIATELPLVVEFYDDPEKIIEIMQHISSFIKAEHMLLWSAKVLSHE